jgi:hypothetical protein
MNYLLDRLDKFPKHTRFTAGGRIANISNDIMELILKAIYSPAKKSYLEEINFQSETLRIYCRLIKDRKYISIAQYEFLANEINTAGKMTGGWIKQCKE